MVGIRPETVSCRYLGATIDVVDADVLFGAARQGSVAVLHDVALPPGVTSIEVALGLDSRGSAFRLTGTVTAVPRRPFQRPDEVGSAVLPATAVAMLLGGVAGLVTLTVLGYSALRDRREAAAVARDGREAAPRQEISHAVTGTATDAAEPAAGTVTDAETGMVATLSASGPRTLTATAAIPAAETSAGQLAAFVRILMTVAVKMSNAGDDTAFWAGRRVRLSRYPGGRTILPGSDVLRLDQIGGMDHVVAQLREVADSFNHPAAMARWGTRRPQGLLFYGPPGTGKTTLAKALALEIGGRLREVRTPDILDKWVGSSERNIKAIFAEARRYRTPTVLLFDEFDSIISYVGAPDHSADQMVNSVAGIFKQEMNTLIAENPNVIVVATTNFPDKVDESLTRSGRFDVKISVPLPSATGRAAILTGMVRQLVADHETDGFRMFADDVNVVELANVTPGMTGADLRELLRRVRMAKAMAEARHGSAAPICQQDLLDALGGMRRHA
jgi:transitional endoplasmic reticulum ATPase